MAAPSPLVEITEAEYGVRINLKYATTDNFTGRTIYDPHAHCFLTQEAAADLKAASARAQALGYKLMIYDAFRPTDAQWKLWNYVPDGNYVSDPTKGFSNHARGAALDVTLIGSNGQPLDMGTKFDDFTPRAHTDATDISPAARQNREILASIMTESGFAPYRNEWWHFQLPDGKKYPAYSDKDAHTGMMTPPQTPPGAPPPTDAPPRAKRYL